MQDGYNYRYVKRIPLCNITKKTLENCISTILQGQILRLDTLGLVGYFTSLEDISLCPLTIYVKGQSLLFSFGAKFLSCINSLSFRDFPVHLCSKHKIDCFRVIPFNSVLHFLFLIKFEF